VSARWKVVENRPVNGGERGEGGGHHGGRTRREEAGSYACSAPPTLSERDPGLNLSTFFSRRTATRKSVRSTGCCPAATDPSVTASRVARIPWDG